jgi:aspartyl-tRNA(Asn)/glutamyl-tRNA(Gln) amidotransferase subunit B
VIEQRYPALQYIVQDGGSSDGTVEAIRRFAGAIARIDSARDHGQADAINRGFAHASGDVLAYLNETGTTADALPLTGDALAELVVLVQDGTISRKQAKEVLAECLRAPLRPRAVVEARGLAQVSDEATLGTLVDDVLAANADAVTEYRAGDDKARKKKRGFLMGEVMKASRGQGNPAVLNRLHDERLG